MNGRREHALPELAHRVISASSVPLTGSAGGPAGDQRDLGALDLVDRGAAELLDRLAHVGHADDVGLREVAAVRVHGDGAAWPADVALGDERAALADRAEAVVLELHDDHRREVVVEERDVDVVGRDAGHLVHALRHGPVARRREVLVGLLEVREDRRAPATHAAVRRAP